jgi:hypothetical protein
MRRLLSLIYKNQNHKYTTLYIKKFVYYTICYIFILFVIFLYYLLYFYIICYIIYVNTYLYYKYNSISDNQFSKISGFDFIS